MHLSQTAALLQLLPLFASAASIGIATPRSTEDFSAADVAVVSEVPTMKYMHSLYPDVFHANGSSLIPLPNVHDRNGSSLVHVDATQATPDLVYKFASGSIVAAGYYAFLGGEQKVNAAADACRQGENHDGFRCVTATLGAVIAHAWATGVGIIGGKQVVEYVWTRAALEAIVAVTGGMAGGAAKRADCPSRQWNRNPNLYFDGNIGAKLTAKNFCKNPSGPQQVEVQNLAGQIIDGMRSKGATEVQFTIYQRNDGHILSRNHFQLDVPDRVDACADFISGGEDCFFRD